MIGLDSNVLLRYLMQDDAVQSPKATSIIESLTNSDPGYLSVVVLAETAWALRSTYKIPAIEIATAVVGLLQSANLVVQEEQAVVEALHASREGRGTFADALIGVLATKAGCERILTFDRRSLRLPAFELI
jgi:predicted nucleic-acid-binding protein